MDISLCTNGDRSIPMPGTGQKAFPGLEQAATQADTRRKKMVTG